MSDWPPKPLNDETSSRQPNAPVGQEWKILEKAVLASVDEQKKARRWGIFFKFLTFAYIFFALLMMGKGCSSTETAATTKSSPHLAVVNIVGTIGAEQQDVNSADTAKALKRAFEASGSQAIALNINSPGGSPVQSDEIWKEIQYYKAKYPKKKVYAVIGDTGASGAYYIASAADEIIVNPSSLVGSIGVIMPNYGLSQLMKKLGVEDRTLTAGDNKALLSMTQPLDPEQKAHVQALLNNVHQHFIDAVKKGRGDKLKAADNSVFSGLFWTGEQAVALGVADRTGSLNDLARELKLETKLNYTIQRSPLESLLGQVGASVGSGLASAVVEEVHTQQSAQLY